jgi:hypothetical protein
MSKLLIILVSVFAFSNVSFAAGTAATTTDVKVTVEKGMEEVKDASKKTMDEKAADATDMNAKEADKKDVAK